MRNCQSRLTMTRAVSGLSGDASQFASAARRPVADCRRRSAALDQTLGNPGLHAIQLMVRIADLQDERGRRILGRVVDTANALAGRARLVQLDLVHLAPQRRALFAIFGRERVHHFVPD